MKYFSYRPDAPPPPCDQPGQRRIRDHDTVRLVVAPESENPRPNCPLELYEPTPTGGLYEGQINRWRWEGYGALTLPSGVKYVGQFKDGKFHGTGTLHFTSGAKYEGEWDNGICTNGLYTFADGLAFSSSDWKYCRYPDRRYRSEIQHGLKPAGRSQITDAEPPRVVPDGFFDTGDGLYDPKCRIVYDYEQPKRIIRVVTDQENKWIMANCRHGGDAFCRYSPELHQDVQAINFKGEQSKYMPDISSTLQLSDIVAPPPREPGQWLRQPGERGGTPVECKVTSIHVVQEVVKAAEKIAQTVANVVSGAQKRITEIEADARSMLSNMEESLSSAESTVGSVLEKAKRQLANSSSDGSNTDWTLSSDDEKNQSSSVVVTSSSNESVTPIERAQKYPSKTGRKSDPSVSGPIESLSDTKKKREDETHDEDFRKHSFTKSTEKADFVDEKEYSLSRLNQASGVSSQNETQTVEPNKNTDGSELNKVFSAGVYSKQGISNEYLIKDPSANSNQKAVVSDENQSPPTELEASYNDQDDAEKVPSAASNIAAGVSNENELASAGSNNEASDHETKPSSSELVRSSSRL